MNMPAFEIAQEGTTVTVSPRESVVTSQQMRDLIDDVTPRLEQGGASSIIFDMSHVEYLDSACIARFISLLQQVKQANGKIALAHCQSNVAFLLQMSRLDKLFDIVDSMDEALERLREIV